MGTEGKMEPINKDQGIKKQSGPDGGQGTEREPQDHRNRGAHNKGPQD